jgi:hypothetical protein
MSSTKVITGKVRFSYAHVFEPSAINEGDDKKYSVSILIPKKDLETLAKIKKAVEAAKQEGKGKWNGKIPPVLKLPLRDGDAERPDDEAYEGMMFLNASSKNKPGIVDENTDPVMSKDDFYSGCFGRASVNFYAFNVSGNKGIAVGLNNLQKLEDGDRLSGGPSAADDFGSDEDLLG